MATLKETLSVGELLNALNNGRQLPGKKIIDIDFTIGRKSDGYNDRDSAPGGIPYVSEVVITWGSK